MKFRAVIARCAALVIAFSLLSFFAQARFPQPSAEYQARRTKLRAQLDGPLVLLAYTSREDSSEFAVFFQETSFYYLTGDSEPDAAILLLPDSAQPGEAKGPREILYLPPRDLRLEKWDGPKMGPDDPGIAQKTGFETVRPFAQLKTDLEALGKTYKTVYTILPPKVEDGYPHFTDALAFVRSAMPAATVKDAAPAIYAMRQVKSPGEIALLQKAVDLSVDAQIAAMHDMRPGLYEYQIAARMKEVHELGGCEREAVRADCRHGIELHGAALQRIDRPDHGW